jgi:hypothetical protein
MALALTFVQMAMDALASFQAEQVMGVIPAIVNFLPRIQGSCAGPTEFRDPKSRLEFVVTWLMCPSSTRLLQPPHPAFIARFVLCFRLSARSAGRMTR